MLEASEITQFIPLASIEQVGETNSTWFAALENGKRIKIGRTARYMSKKRWDVIACELSGRPLPWMSREQWDYTLRELAEFRRCVVLPSQPTRRPGRRKARRSH